MDRRKFIQHSITIGSISTLAAHCGSTSAIKGGITGANAKTGHLLRDKTFTSPATAESMPVVIIGAGISGLSAAWHLQKKGFSNFVLLDLEDHAGGNAAHGSNAVSNFPLGAHYVPIPNINLTEYIAFLQEAGVVEGFDSTGLPIYNEYHLCREPEERLYLNGRWQEGLIPSFGLTETDLKDIKSFLNYMDHFRNQVDEEGREAFAIPVNRSSTDSQFTRLDKITMKDFLKELDLNSAYLHWYVNYCTRDDFGTAYDECSAWAGVHYFAGRKGKAKNADHSDVLTWPEGNGFLVDQFMKKLEGKILTGSMVTTVKEEKENIRIEYLDVKKNQLKAFDAKQCIIAIPQFIAARLLNDKTRLAMVSANLQYAPWMVANLVVGSLTERTGMDHSWDNVLYESRGLGYVDATHQLLQQVHTERNLTYYWPVTHLPAKEARQWLQQQTHEQWVDMICDDLQVVHPEIRTATKEVNITLWGHAMAQPIPGLIFGELRKELSASVNQRIHFAHTDLAGISIFEEGFYQGLEAAEKVWQQLS
ncbi:FAD-dependent oxidoreductase [Pseudoflavitalea rhizosphaerae]|uniref:FAD-dependent oxidoreductase n=1 Tax=Pseudoflavitalea rhizosphaerae TaxID=1884793 RepID=UPI000F8D3BA3|nr:FAD-dependent oxidoreductase [Pseudoflavitalea rhizosphaerae]